jgi:hypothetical protein
VVSSGEGRLRELAIRNSRQESLGAMCEKRTVLSLRGELCQVALCRSALRLWLYRFYRSLQAAVMWTSVHERDLWTNVHIAFTRYGV